MRSRRMARASAPNSMRKSSGNMIVLALALLLGVGVAILMFSLSFVRILGTNQEQRTAIEAAALAAARDLSRVVVEDPNFGFISLSDYAPAAPNTRAQDGQAMPVTSINTLFATIRLDMLIANQMNDATMRIMADRDYANAMTAKNFLVNALQTSILPGSGGVTFHDVDGNAISPYQAAVDAYKSNQVRMAGGNSRMVNNSLRLTLGCLSTPAVTATPTPKPNSLGQVSSSQESGGYYLSYVNIPAQGRDFVFAAIGRDLRLVNNNSFTQTPQGLPYFVPTIVKAEADHIIASVSDPQGKVVHAVSCAQPASVQDPRPAPGAFTISFPDGTIAEIIRPGDLLTHPLLSGTTLNVKSAQGGDVPGGGTLVPGTVAPFGSTMPATQATAMGWYHWLRRAGTKPNIQAVKNMTNAGFGGGITASIGGVNVYTFNEDGTIRYAQMLNTGPRTVVASENQGYVSGVLTSPSSGVQYDVIGTDEVYMPGRMLGGMHGGEPLTDGVVTASAGAAAQTIASSDLSQDAPLIAGLLALASMAILALSRGFAGVSRNSKAGPVMAIALSLGSLLSLFSLTACGSGAPPPAQVVTTSNVGPRVVRPTYTQNGLAVDLTFKKKN